MKSIVEIQLMLVAELWKFLSKIKSISSRSEYYNEILGDTSFLLADLLGSLLKSENDWDSRKWLDDSLLTNVKLNKNRLSISGIIIWGIENSTEQWTDPFYFEIDLHQNEADFSEYTFLFCDFNKPEIPYEEFRLNHKYWEQSDHRDWKYVINIKK